MNVKNNRCRKNLTLFLVILFLILLYSFYRHVNQNKLGNTQHIIGIHKNFTQIDMGRILKIEKSLKRKYEFCVNKTNNSSNTINVAFVSVGKKVLSDTEKVITSLLKFADSSINIHLISDKLNFETAKSVLRIYPDQNHEISFYDFQAYVSLVDFIPSAHWSGPFSLMKLLIPDILPLMVEKIIVLDVDLDVKRSISGLWEHFKDFKDNQMLGMATEQTDWYVSGLRKWPAKGRGYNSGVILLDLVKLRSMRWYWFWRAELLRFLVTFKRLDLGDQDVLNVLAYKYPDLVFTIPYNWNKMSLYYRNEVVGTDVNILHFIKSQNYLD